MLVKTFSLDMKQGNPASRQRLETRLLHFQQMPAAPRRYGDQYWHGYTYVWNDEQTDAELLDAEGSTATTRSRIRGTGRQTQADVALPQPGRVYAVPHDGGEVRPRRNTLQMNKDHDYGGAVANQLATLDHIGLFTKPLAAEPASSRGSRIIATAQAGQSISAARAYLHANCSPLPPQVGRRALRHVLLSTLPLEETKTVGVPPIRRRVRCRGRAEHCARLSRALDDRPPHANQRPRPHAARGIIGHRQGGRVR